MAATFKTEAQVFVALSKRYPKGEYAVLPSVRDGAGHSANRTIDAIVMSLWPSRGLELHGIEIKVHRGDWLRERRDPEKQESVFQRCDRFWLAVGDASIVKDEEVPESWGLLVPRGKGLVVKKQAPKLEASTIDRSFLAAVLKRAMRHADTPDARQRMREEIQADNETRIARAIQQDKGDEAREIMALREKMKYALRFEEKSGVSLAEWGRIDEAAALVQVLENLRGPMLSNRIWQMMRSAEAMAKIVQEHAKDGMKAAQALRAVLETIEKETEAE